MEFGIVTGPLLDDVASRLEGLGYDTVLFSDSQCKAPDVWTALGAAAVQTSSVQLGPGVTNALTRDPSVTASAAATLHHLTQGRAVLPIGRGDSAAHAIGQHPEKLHTFEGKVEMIRKYLAGGAVQRGETPEAIAWLPLALSHGPIPLELVPSGPKVAAIAARHADRISFAIGSDPEYLSHFLQETRQQVIAVGRDPSQVKFGAWVNVILNDNRATALSAVRGSTSIWARFSLMRPDRENLPAPLRKAQVLVDQWDMTAHGSADAEHARAVPDSVVDWFAIAGDEQHVFDRLKQLTQIGLDYLYIVPGELGFQDEVGKHSIETLARSVLPALR